MGCLLAALLAAGGTARADEADTLKVTDIEEVVVIATPKENRKLREQPAAVTLLSQQEMQDAQVRDIKSLTAVVPNIFIPDYGSGQTSAIYIRGIGSRINTPAVGLYVDNMPYINQSAFDFSYADVERIDVLRGPQGTLYGRNAMGGLIKIHTKSPFDYQGTDLRAGAATRGDYQASLTHYHRISPHFAFSAGGFYQHEGGFFRNAARNNEKIDREEAGGGRLHAIWLPSDDWKLDLNVSYEYADRGGYPYGLYDPTTGSVARPAYDERSSYYRSLLNTGLNAEYHGRHFTLSAVTGYQHLGDRMFLDQDFSPEPIFNLTQKQRMNTLSEEVVLKSRADRRWQWTTGAFGFYQWLHTDGPVTFHREGIDQIIEGNANEAFDKLVALGAPQMHLAISNESLPVSGSFDTPTLSAALFHQSTLNDLFVKGLSLTVGLRLDYEHLRLRYRSAATPADFRFSMSIQRPGMPQAVTVESGPLQGTASYDGRESTDYLQLLPKFALQYEWRAGNNVYLTATRGYRSGGYNIQMFSDLVSSQLRNGMMDAIAADEKFSSYAAMIERMKQEVPDVKEATLYKPEYTWNYEAGTHLTLWDGRLTADLSAFLMETRDQQVSRFADNGLGRITVNAGKSRSMGGEASLRTALTSSFSLNLSYGYTYAVFREYDTRADDASPSSDGSSPSSDDSSPSSGTSTQSTDYSGRYVPFVPKHTLNVGGQYTFRLRTGQWLDAIRLNAGFTGAGRIYWTESNTVSQAFYGTLNGRLTFCKGGGEVDLWVRNALDKDYAAFYFESLGQGFMQPGRPVQAGVEVRMKF